MAHCPDEVAALRRRVAELEQENASLRARLPGASPRTGCPYTANPLDGIIAALTARCGGNVAECGIVRITACSDKFGAAHNAADLLVDSIFQSDSRPNEWLCYDFQARRIAPTHYTLRTTNQAAGGLHIRSWVVEGSVTGTRWETLDKRKNCDDLNGPRLVRTFPIAQGREVALIRIRQKDVNHMVGPYTPGVSGGKHSLVLSDFEIFGELIE
jgi:hypothetical protein